MSERWYVKRPSPPPPQARRPPLLSPLEAPMPMPTDMEANLHADFDAWFKCLQALTSEPLYPPDWTERWFDGYTPEEALEDGPDAE